MIDVKINASFVLPGGTLPAEPSLLKKGEKKKKRKEKEEKQNDEQLQFRQEVIRLEKGNQIVISLREAKVARQSLHLSIEAYEYMTSDDNPAPKIKLFEWKRLSKNKRVKAHLQDIAAGLGGKLESFTILED